MMSGKLAKIFLLGLSMIVLLGGCQASPTASDGEQERAFPVQTVSLGTGLLEEGKTLIGEISPNSSVSVVPKVSAKVISISVAKGDLVQAGQTLATLEQTDYLNNVKQAETSLATAKANLANAIASQEYNVFQSEQGLENAKLSYENVQLSYQNALNAYNDVNNNHQRMAALFEANAISKREFEQSEMQLVQAEAGLQQSELALKQAEVAITNAEKAVEQAKRTEGIKVSEASVLQAELSLSLAREQLENTVIKAPVAGEVTTINVEIGEIASQQGAFFNIIQVNPMLVKAKLTEELLTSFAVGDTVTIRVKAVNQELQGTVRYVSSVTEQQTKAYIMEVEFVPADSVVKSGMIAEIINQSRQQGTEVLLLPIEALIMENQNYHVFVVADQRAEKRQVQLGQENNNYVEVIDGLQVGDQVIVKGHLTIEEGALIQVTGGN